MKKTLSFLLLLIAFAMPAFAQVSSSRARRVQTPASDPSSCPAGTVWVRAGLFKICLTDGVPTTMPSAATSPGGSNTQIQFNDSSAFGGDSGLTFNKTTDDLTVGRNVAASNLAPGFATTATAAGTTTLTVASKGVQEFTGSTTQTVTLPVVSTLPQTGFGFLVVNKSSGVVTVQSSGGNTVQAMAANTSAIFTCAALTGTGASSWTVTYIAAGGGSCSASVTVPLLLSSTSVDLNEGTAAKQPLYTCPANRRCVVTNIVMQKWSASVGEPLLFSVGWNAGASDVVGTVDFTLFTAPSTSQALYTTVYDGGAGNVAFSPSATIGAAADVLGLIVSTPFGSALTVRVDVFGYLTDTSGVPVANVCGP